MRPDEKIIAEAIRVEVDDPTGKVYLVFEVKDEKMRQYIKKHWIDNIEFKLIGKNLVENE